jgi:O-methyltransferase involved in polyketide biosynthesis
VSFFEVDHPATSAAKALGIASVGQRKNLIQIAADLGTQTLSRVLEDEGRWDESKRSVVLAEGLLQYLEHEDVRDLFCEAARSTGAGSRIVFSHAIPDQLRLLHAMLRLVGEPFASRVRSEDLPEYIDGTGWSVVSEVDTDANHGLERYAVADRL